MTAIVCDMDGTLSNCVHRQHLAEAGKWDDFHSLLFMDQAYPDVVWFLNQIPKEDVVIILTGRDEAYREKTHKWIFEQKLADCVDHLIMRPELNYVPDHILKPRLLEEHIGSKDMVLNEVAVVLEDRDKVVEAWRNYGLPCWQVRPGGY